MRLYYAQNKEDLLIKGFFPDIKNGFYIDVGANDPIIDSVTKLLYDEGWSGINVEPIRKLTEALRQERPRDTTLQIGLSDKNGTLTFTEYPEGNGLSTFDHSMREYYTHDNHGFPTASFKTYQVPVKTLSEIIAEVCPASVQVLKIDVEGYEYEVLAGNDWELYRPELICVEANHITRDWRPILAKHHYELVFFDGVNNYYLAQEAMRRKAYFNYPDIAFSGNPVYYPAYLEIQARLKQEWEAKLSIFTAQLHDQEEQITFLHRQQRDVRFLARRLALEAQLRLHKRANGRVQRVGLVYKPDPTLKQQISERISGADELLSFVHERDAVNVRRQATSLAMTIKPIPWRIVSWSFDTGLLIGKKLARKFV